jgi:hypothetical protein
MHAKMKKGQMEDYWKASEHGYGRPGQEVLAAGVVVNLNVALVNQFDKLPDDILKAYAETGELPREHWKLLESGGGKK